MNKRHWCAFLILATTALHAVAQNIDFNMTNRQDAEVNEPDYIGWAVNQGASESKTLENGLTITVAAAGKANTLRAQWHKNTCTAGRNGQTGLRLLGDVQLVVFHFHGSRRRFTHGVSHRENIGAEVIRRHREQIGVNAFRNLRAGRRRGDFLAVFESGYALPDSHMNPLLEYYPPVQGQLVAVRFRPVRSVLLEVHHGENGVRVVLARVEPVSEEHGPVDYVPIGKLIGVW